MRRLPCAATRCGSSWTACSTWPARVRDFRGISADAFDGRGNYALGVKEQLIFPEIEYDKIDKIRGMDIVVCTTAKTDEGGPRAAQAGRRSLR